MPRLGRSQLLRKWSRWSNWLDDDRRPETPKEAEARRLAEARRAARGSM